MEERCDQIVDCRDKSDENECSLLVFEESYNKKVPPFTLDQDDNELIPVQVKVSTSLRNVLEIAEFSHTIDLKFGITLEWFENRVEYHNLKTKVALNVLSDREVGMLWIPYIIFRNTDNDEAVSVEQGRTVVSVTRQGDFVRSGPETADEVEIFKGDENMITMNQTQSKKFHCTYLLHYYPFDTQVCTVDFQLEIFARESVELVPHSIEMLSPTELTQYYIKSYKLVYQNTSKTAATAHIYISKARCPPPSPPVLLNSSDNFLLFVNNC